MRNKTHIPISFALAFLLGFLFFAPFVVAQDETNETIDRSFSLEDFDPFASDALSETDDEEIDKLKTSDQLITEADFLLEDQRLLDGRTKLMRAIKKDPSNYRAHMLLSGYYLVHVGHFKLSLRYIRQAQSLFEKKNGLPPYSEKRAQLEHGHLLYLLSQARLNLDDYLGALKVLDEYESYGYSATWYPGTRAWILMKLGRMNEAIKVARLGVLQGAEPGRTLNMLGILLSMSGQRNEALSIFRDAISYELSLGSLGQPATPLNNSGEVYKEMFEDERAESNWLRAASMPDGCEHFLPTLNVSLLYFEQINLSAVSRSVTAFEQCIAQYPLKNGEEHKALLSFTRAKVLQLSGHPEEAIVLFNEALKSRQWFGKIGTSQDDLQVATMSALSMSHQAAANRLKFFVSDNFFDSVLVRQRRMYHLFWSWWFERKARRQLSSKMNQLEDLSVRNTDSMLEYPTLGYILKGLNPSNLQKRIDQERLTDNRPEATKFYQGYLAESLLHHRKNKQALYIIDQTLPLAREKFDSLFKVHLLSARLSAMPVNSDDYSLIAWLIFKQNRFIFRNYGFALPVTIKTDSPAIASVLNKAGYLNHQKESEFLLTVSVNNFSNDKESGKEYTAEVQMPVIGRMKLSAPKLTDLINRLNETIFSKD